MSWRCPACQIAIWHSEVEPMPRAGVVYRCYVCPLELVLDPDTMTLVLAPLEPEKPLRRPWSS